MADFRSKLPHLLLRGTSHPEKYKSPNQIPRPKFPQRHRIQHAELLLSELQTAIQDGKQRKGSLPVGVSTAEGIILEFESSLDFDITLKSLDLPSQGIELLAAKNILVEEKAKTIATVFVPDEKVAIFIKKVEEYRDKETKTRKPKNAALVDSIEHIRLAVVKTLWTDLDEFFPDTNQPIWWEVWLRALPEAIPKFQNFAQIRDIPISNRTILFPDRHVILAYATAEQFASAIDSIGFIAELRKAKESTADFLKMGNSEQREWAHALSGLTNRTKQAPIVCILDTGIQNKHPLINPFLPTSKLMTCNPDWGSNDHQGHGTAMAGLALYGDLENALLSTQNILVPCDLESVKILPTNGENSPTLFGSITEEAVSRATIGDPNR